MPIVGRQYRRLREVETPLTRAARVGYAGGREDPLTEDVGGGYCVMEDTPRGSSPKKTLAPGTPAPARSLPAWVPGLADLWPADERQWPGAVTVVRCRSTSEAFVADALDRERVSYYLPYETVSREYRYGPRVVRRRWSRALLPGHLIVGDGYRGREAAAQVGRRFGDTVFGFIDVVSSAAPFRSQLLSLSVVLAADPELRVVNGIVPGGPVRVTAGPFLGAVGVLVEERQGHAFAVTLPLFGRSVEVEIPLENLEAAEGESPRPA